MTDEYSGPERRQFARRDDDRKCPNCDLLWEHHDRDRREHREIVCNKIHDVKEDVVAVKNQLIDQGRAHASFVPRWMFLIICGSMLSVGLGASQYIVSHINRGNDEIGKQITTVHRRITETDQDREALKDKLIELQWSVNAIGTRLSLVEAKMEKPSK